MICDDKWFLSNSLCVLYPLAKARRWKRHNSLDKKHISSRSWKILIINTRSVFFSNVTLEIIQTHFIIFHAVLPLFKSTNFEYSAKSLKNETNKNITLETLNFKLTQLYLAERKHTLWQYHLICLYRKSIYFVLNCYSAQLYNLSVVRT